MGPQMAGLNAGKRFGKCFGKCHTLGRGVSLGFAAVPEVMVSAVSSLVLQLVVAQSLAVPDPSLGAQVTHEPKRSSSPIRTAFIVPMLWKRFGKPQLGVAMDTSVS